nr:hypothetical protein [Tanacetum cinerariifolium]
MYPNTDQRVKRNLRHSVKERMMKTMMSMAVKMIMTNMTVQMTIMIEDDDQENVSGETELYDDEDDFVHPNLSTYNANDQEEEDEEEMMMMKCLLIKRFQRHLIMKLRMKKIIKRMMIRLWEENKKMRNYTKT